MNEGGDKMEIIVKGVSVANINEIVSGTCNYDCGTYK